MRQIAATGCCDRNLSHEFKRFVSFVLLSHCVDPSFVDVRICQQQFYPNKAFWNDGMTWGKTAVICAFGY